MRSCKTLTKMAKKKKTDRTSVGKDVEGTTYTLPVEI